MYKGYLITVFSYIDKGVTMFRVYAKNLQTNELVNPIINGKFLATESYKESLKLIKKHINKK